MVVAIGKTAAGGGGSRYCRRYRGFDGVACAGRRGVAHTERPRRPEKGVKGGGGAGVGGDGVVKKRHTHTHIIIIVHTRGGVKRA